MVRVFTYKPHSTGTRAISLQGYMEIPSSLHWYLGLLLFAVVIVDDEQIRLCTVGRSGVICGVLEDPSHRALHDAPRSYILPH